MFANFLVNSAGEMVQQFLWLEFNMRYDLLDHRGEVLMSDDSLEPIAEYLELTATYLYVRLSAHKGKFVRGKGPIQMTLVDNGRDKPENTKRGAKKRDYRYVALYHESETGMEYKEPHEVTIDEVVKATGLARSTVMQRFASYQEVSAMVSRAPTCFRKERVVFKRLPPADEAQSSSSAG